MTTEMYDNKTKGFIEKMEDEYFFKVARYTGYNGEMVMFGVVFGLFCYHF